MIDEGRRMKPKLTIVLGNSVIVITLGRVAEWRSSKVAESHAVFSATLALRNSATRPFILHPSAFILQ
jgi:hypothetical protein